jgi:hypothetical protein
MIENMSLLRRIKDLADIADLTCPSKMRELIGACEDYIELKGGNFTCAAQLFGVRGQVIYTAAPGELIFDIKADDRSIFLDFAEIEKLFGAAKRRESLKGGHYIVANTKRNFVALCSDDDILQADKRLSGLIFRYDREE